MRCVSHRGKSLVFARGALRRFGWACLIIAGLSAESALADNQRRQIVVKTEPAAEGERPLAQRTILISLRKQRLRLLDGEAEVANSRISSGQPGFDTPTGVFSILEKSEYHESNIYEGAPMPFMQRITWSGIAMHAGVVPGYRASHGCIRLPYAFAKMFFGKTGVGGRVIITQDEVSPVRFEHPNLFKPLPANDPAPVREAAADGRRVAVADASPDDRNSLSGLISVATPAAAGEPSAAASASGKPRSRAEAQRLLNERLQRLQEDLATAEAKKVAASEKAKVALRTAEDAESKLRTVRQPFEAVLKTASAAEAARSAAAAAYRNFLSVTAVRGEASSPTQADDRELDLEDRLLDATVELARTKAATAEANLAIADAKSASAAAETAKASALEEVRTTIATLRSAQAALIELQKDVQRRAKPLSIFVSLKSQRIFIRQGFEPVLEAPITVDDPPGAVGTHVLTVIDYDKAGDNFDWQLVTAQQPRPFVEPVEDAPKNKKDKRSPLPVTPRSPLNIEAANVALDAIRVPQEVQEMIAERARPGTSLIISERDLSGETGKGTEFVVLTKPQ